MKATTILLLLIVLAAPAGAALVHDEAVDGDLSTDPAAPTPLTFSAGSNTITGTISSAGGVDRDYITFTLAPDEVLTAINLLALTPTSAE